MAKLIDADKLREDWLTNGENEHIYDTNAFLDSIDEQPTVDAAPVVHGRWEWFEEWNPSTPDHQRECDDCGWRCGHCKTSLTDMVGGYWDNYYEEPKVNYCPNCGAKMDGDTNG